MTEREATNIYDRQSREASGTGRTMVTYDTTGERSVITTAYQISGRVLHTLEAREDDRVFYDGREIHGITAAEIQSFSRLATGDNQVDSAEARGAQELLARAKREAESPQR